MWNLQEPRGISRQILTPSGVRSWRLGRRGRTPCNTCAPKETPTRRSKGRNAPPLLHQGVASWTTMETPWARVGAALRAARKAQQLTQAELAARADVSAGTIRAIERGTEFQKV